VSTAAAAETEGVNGHGAATGAATGDGVVGSIEAVMTGLDGLWVKGGEAASSLTANSVRISVALSEVTWSVVALSLSAEGPLFGREDSAGATHSSSAALGGELVGAGDMIAPPMHFAKV